MPTFPLVCSSTYECALKLALCGGVCGLWLLVVCIYTCVCVCVCACAEALKQNPQLSKWLWCGGLEHSASKPNREWDDRDALKERGYAVGKLRNWKVGGESGILLEMANAACCEERVVGPDEWCVGEGLCPLCLALCQLCVYPQGRWSIQLSRQEGHLTIGCGGEGGSKDTAREATDIGWGWTARVTVCLSGRDREAAQTWSSLCVNLWRSREHQSKAFLTIIDLKMAYDSVPSQAMKLTQKSLTIWLIMQILPWWHGNYTQAGGDDDRGDPGAKWPSHQVAA